MRPSIFAQRGTLTMLEANLCTPAERQEFDAGLAEHLQRVVDVLGRPILSTNEITCSTRGYTAQSKELAK